MSTGADETPLLEARGIQKRFGDVVVLRDANFAEGALPGNPVLQRRRPARSRRSSRSTRTGSASSASSSRTSTWPATGAGSRSTTGPARRSSRARTINSPAIKKYLYMPW